MTALERRQRNAHGAMLQGAPQTQLSRQLSAVVVLVLIPCGQQHDIKVANGEEHYTPAMSEWDDELSKLLVPLGSTTTVRREREDRHCALYGIAESKQARVVRRIACKLPLNDMFLQALNVFLERDGSDNPILGSHPLDRLFLAATAARMRCCAPSARSRMPARKSSAVIRPTPLSAKRKAFLARAIAASCSERNAASWETAFSMNCVSDSPLRSTASRLAFVSGVTRIGGKVAERLMHAVYSNCYTSVSPNVISGAAKESGCPLRSGIAPGVHRVRPQDMSAQPTLNLRFRPIAAVQPRGKRTLLCSLSNGRRAHIAFVNACLRSVRINAVLRHQRCRSCGYGLDPRPPDVRRG